jgi:hypothetical protein
LLAALTNLNDPNTRQWLVIGMAVATLAYAVIRPMLKKKDPMSRAPASSSLAQQRSVEREMSNLLVELSEMTRQLSAQLDNRSTKLEELMRQADEKIAALRAAGSLPPAPASTALLPADGEPNGQQNTHPLAALGLTPADNVGVPTRPALPDNSASASALAGRLAVDPRHAQIYAFVDQGLTPQEIAQRLGRPAGEIQLILALRSRG